MQGRLHIQPPATEMSDMIRKVGLCVFADRIYTGERLHSERTEVVRSMLHFCLYF
jgi:hypothetical protein